jgi:hypothetical protein
LIEFIESSFLLVSSSKAIEPALISRVFSFRMPMPFPKVSVPPHQDEWAPVAALQITLQEE